MEIKNKNGHYELYINGKRYSTGDTYSECARDYEEYENSKTKKGESKVAKANDRVRSAMKEFFEKMKAMDSAIPEELAEDALELAEEVNDALAEEMEDELPDVLEVTKDEGKEVEAKMEDTLTRILMKHGVIKDTSMNALDELEEELKAKDKCDENTLDADNEEAVERSPSEAKDSTLTTIRQMKRDMAKIKDAGLRKRLSDNLAKTLRLQTDDQYSSVFNAAKKSATDSVSTKAKSTVDADYDFGMDIAKRFNPQYKKEG